MEVLLNGVGYLKMVFSDGSEKVIKTTLNTELLQEYGVNAKQNFLFCIDTGNFIALREDAVEITVSADYPSYDSEVNAFANRFI